MHIEPGLVDGAKLTLSYATAAACGAYTIALAADMLKRDGAPALLLRALLATGLVFCFFELLPHHPMGVSEVHLILGTTLMLVLGTAPAAIGLAAGLLIQGLFFEPVDLPQYAMNVTTLLAPLFASAALARRIIPDDMAYVDLCYGQALKLSLVYQGGIVLWVAFWALYGGGLGIDNLESIGHFAAAYLGVVLAEPLIDLAALAAAKAIRPLRGSALVIGRLHQAARS